ncbi:MAG: hypothetical protein AAGF12_30665 [Myxococcota bacterium]
MLPFGLVLVLLGGCGRVAFDPQTEDASLVDAPVMDRTLTTTPDTSLPDTRPRDAVVDRALDSSTDVVVPTSDAEIDGTADAVSVECVGNDDCDDGLACTGDTCIMDRCIFIAMRLDGDNDGSNCGTDCNDFVADAFPGQSVFFEVGYNDADGIVSFDYNCDGVAEPSTTDIAPDCTTLMPPDCGPAEGWSGAVPPCGQAANYETCIRVLDVCSSLTTMRRQTCR